MFFELCGIKRCVVKVADGEGDGVGSRGPKVVPSTHKVLSRGHMSVEIEIQASAPALAARGRTAPSAAEPNGVSVGREVVIIRHVVGRYASKCSYFCEFACRSIGAVCYALSGFGEVAYRKKEIPYNEGILKDIGARVRYTVL